ncbi:BtrH N-terminal domain-containing protein [Brevibacillus sp. SYP-B805]|uniref:BtrH N-terminal domain-containing protein n=1 Tax=Brevibacillus sp. SYP-B805 TaxID=1578199 RepID=UPI0013EDFBFA|nr:BtrH N-terminal domain-containing protein [Brevibacillus sp. SYP-B805]NGQ95284.1 BtrH N-terminal domain-containing protein [Brevibacillus sp. SYP-B805]
MGTTAYIGNGAYCYANSTAMLLHSIGEKIAPSLIEVLTGVGLGAMWEEALQFAWFNGRVAPDEGIGRALDLLGFTFLAQGCDTTSAPPVEDLRTHLKDGPAVVGPLDMGMLLYHPNHSYLGGSDHYVLVYAADDENVYLHDPAGYPHVSLAWEPFGLAWRAEKIPYRRYPYQFWTRPSRQRTPAEQELFGQAIRYFQTVYRETEEEAGQKGLPCCEKAIRAFADAIEQETITPEGRNHMRYFLFQLGARRALDYANFFARRLPGLARLKERQAQLFGTCHVHAVADNRQDLAAALRALAHAEEQFRHALMLVDPV